MNVDGILRVFLDCGVDYLLIGGMNFLLRHEPVLTYDIDLWIRDTAENLARCDAALRTLEAAWGATEQDWRPIGVQYRGLCDDDMITCQMVLPPEQRRLSRIDVLRRARNRGNPPCEQPT